jgi:hypothetical protein
MMDPDPGAQKHVDPDPQHCAKVTKKAHILANWLFLENIVHPSFLLKEM